MRTNFTFTIALLIVIALNVAYAQSGDICIAPGGSSCENTLILELSSGGPVVIEMFPDKAPRFVARMKELARSGFYDGLAFHRAVPGFMVQTGSPNGAVYGGSGQTIKAELNDVLLVRGTVLAARGRDPDSADSQFFILLNAAPHLKGRNTAWGQVTQGMDYVDVIMMGRGAAGFVSADGSDKIISMRVLGDVGRGALREARNTIDGIYAMQILIDFDTLEGVAIDPASGAFTLVGRTTQPGRSVPYLDYLKVAMELPDDANFSLRATPQWQREVDALFKKSSDEVAEQLMFTAGRKKLAPPGTWLFTNCGIDMLGSFSHRPTIGVQLRTAVGGGARAVHVIPGMPADRAGLRKGDRIVAVGSTPVAAHVDAVNALRSVPEGQAVTLRIEPAGTSRGRSTRSIQVTPRKASYARNDNFGLVAALLAWGGNQRGGDIFRSMGELTAAAEHSGTADDEWAKLIADLGITVEVDAVRYSNVSEAQKIERLLSLMLAATERHLRLPAGHDRFMKRYYQLLRQAPANMAMAQVIAEQFTMIAGTLEKNLGAFLDQCADGYVHYPIQLIAKQFKLTGHVVAEYNGIPPNSLVARTVMAVDVILKQLPYQDWLVAEIPAYRTWAEFEKRGARRKGYVWGHMWITSGRVELGVSADGRAMNFRHVPMRFNIEEYSGSGKRRRSKSRPDLDAYANHLSNLYPELAQVFPELHEMRELAKITAVARWFRDRGFHPRLPDSGVVEWVGSAYARGVISIAVDETPKPGRPMAIMTASGGVDLRIEELRRTAIEEYDWHRDLVVMPEPQSSPEIQRLMSTMPSVPPLPKPDGWILKSKLGDRKLAAITVLRANCPQGRDAIEGQQLLDKMERKARVLKHYDNMINQMTSDRMTNLRGLDSARRQADDEIKEMGKETLELLTNGLVSWDNYIGSFPGGDHQRLANAATTGTTGSLPRPLQVLDRAKKVRDALNDLKKLMDAGRAGTFNKEAANQLAKRSMELAEDVLKDLESLSPEGRRMTNAALHRIVSGVKAAFALNDLIDRTVTMMELEQTVDLTNTELGNQAQLAHTVERRQAAIFDEFRADMENYRSRFANCTK